MAAPPPYPGIPRWVKVFAIIALVVVLLFFILSFTRGPHRGHGDHAPRGGVGGHKVPEGAPE